MFFWAGKTVLSKVISLLSYSWGPRIWSVLLFCQTFQDVHAARKRQTKMLSFKKPSLPKTFQKWLTDPIEDFLWSKTLLEFLERGVFYVHLIKWINVINLKYAISLVLILKKRFPQGIFRNFRWARILPESVVREVKSEFDVGGGGECRQTGQ